MDYKFSRANVTRVCRRKGKMSKALVKLTTNDFTNSRIQVPHEICCLCAHDTTLEYFWGHNILSPYKEDLIAIRSCHRQRSRLEDKIYENVEYDNVCWALLYPASHQRYDSFYRFARDSEISYGGNFIADNTRGNHQLSTRLFTIPYFLSLNHLSTDTKEMVSHLREVLPPEYINGACYAMIVMIVFENVSVKEGQ